MIEFKLFGISVSIHPGHWLILALLGGGLNALSGQISWILVALFVIAGFLSILVHEFGHALMIRKYGLPTEIHLITFGGFATMPANELSQKQSFLVTAAGPGIQVALGFLAWAVLQFGNLPDTSIAKFFYDLMRISFIWAIFNCVPVLPLDGGHMLNAILGPKREKTTLLIGVIVAAALAIAAIVFLPGSFLMPIFMGMFAFENWQRYNQL